LALARLAADVLRAGHGIVERVGVWPAVTNLSRGDVLLAKRDLLGVVAA
jgi:hypothetical protein